MSPIPSPTPLRRTIARLLFSPAALLLGFVVLLITTCPGARGEGAIGLLIANDGMLTSASSDFAKLDMAITPVRVPASVSARSTRFDRAPASSARSATPAERSAATRAVGGESDALRHSRSTVPLLVDPLLDDVSSAPAARITPMTGPAVGIRPKLPTGVR